MAGGEIKKIMDKECVEAANEIERLRLENRHLRENAMHSVSAALHNAALAEKDAEIARIRKHFEDALSETCPCCEGMRECLPDCTFAEDAPDAADRMEYLRGVLYGI